MGYLLEFSSEAEIRSIHPNFSELAKIGDIDVMITAKVDAGSKYDFVSRLFALAIGIPEDPVTGEMHCCLASYWANKLGKNSFLAYQASARGGEMKVELLGDRVKLQGEAVIVFRGKLS